MLLFFLIYICALRHIDGVITVTMAPQKMCVLEKDFNVDFNCTIQPPSADNAEHKMKWFFQSELIHFDDETVLDSGVTIKKYKELNNELSIRNIERRDEGHYKCQVEKTAVEDIGELTVGNCLDENPFVRCDMTLSNSTSRTDRNNITMFAGHILHVNISCKAFIGNNVLVNITIINVANHSIASALPVYSHVEEQSSATRGVYVSHAVDVAGLDERHFWCVADHPKMSHPVNCSTPSLMKPKVKINGSADNTQFECKVESYPPFTSYQWKLCRYSGNETNVQKEECEKLNITSSNLNLTNNGEMKDGFVLICEVENAVGTGHSKLTIIPNIEASIEAKDINIGHTDATINHRIKAKDINIGNTNAGYSNILYIGRSTLLFIVIILLLWICRRSRLTKRNNAISD
ncbi:uncharacterized protein LOC117104711 [Anneissia japonica]|uniref:uncharacterized protein LOC117104711 n=1 Tax=Anneissia japonica TaxID=1529436 RepID=UPI00142565A6|nr:uncharacterized protein LOC117104711 [Anneissia japonica]XP_033101484.1 uncharacterized protein LOC117104711 [Anneissia japonica]